MLLHGAAAIDRTPSRGARQLLGKIIPQRLLERIMRGCFLWLLSETINATNIPKDILSVSVLTMSIGKHLPPQEVSQRRLAEDQQCYPAPYPKPVYCQY